MKKVILLAALLTTTQVFSKEKVVYKYKKYEKINLEEISIEGDVGTPGDITITERYLKRFKNKLPEKLNFNFEMYKGLERIR